MRFNSAREAEDYIKRTIGIPYVVFDGFSICILNAVVSSLEEMTSKYSVLKNAISSIGAEYFISKQIESLNSNLSLSEFEYVNDFSAVKVEMQNGYYLAIILASILKHFSIKSKSIETRGHTTAKSIKWGIYHECAHILDFMLCISKAPEFIELIKNKNLELLISKCASTSPLEAFAEAFAKYHIDGISNDLVEQIM